MVEVVSRRQTHVGGGGGGEPVVRFDFSIFGRFLFLIVC